MPTSDRHQLPLRLPRELSERLQAQAKRRRIPLNTYVQMALEDKLDADEARQKQAAGAAPRRDRDRGPRGLGLRDGTLMSEADGRSLPLPAVSEQPAPVVVNVGGPAQGPASDGGLIAGLIAHLAHSPPWEREHKKHYALEVIKAACPTPAARRDAEQKLEEALAQLKRQAAAGRPTIGSIGSLYQR